MKLLSSFILAILCTSAVITSSEPSDPTSTVASSLPGNSSSASVPTTTVVVPTSTQEPPSTTPSEPSTTTAAVTTTTSPTTVSSTTVSPTTIVSTTSESPVTTEAPKPPVAEECSWNITQNNVTCMRVQLKVRFTIHREGKDEYIVLSQNASSDLSDCHHSNETQLFALSESNYYDFTMTFEKAAKKVFVNSTTFKYNLPGGISGYVTSLEKLFTVDDGNSYMCHSTINVKLGNDTTMEIYDMHVQAFGNKDNTNFSTAEECPDDDKVSDAVPIAVGCALAALIIIVLIAYLVGRRQSRQRGYQSV